MNPSVRSLAAAALTLAIVAQGMPTAAAAQQFDPALYGSLQWNSVGIARGGRSIAVAGSAARPNEYYFGATGGGLWKSTDGGQSWRAVTDGKINSSSVGAVGVCEANPDVVYIGTGETEIRGNIMQGDGVYKSTDAGMTWKHLRLAETQAVAKIRIHPANCDVAWVAAFGVHSMPNPERGVFKTTDGGATWRKVLFKSDKAGVIDLALDPSNPDVMYASIWEAWRKSWGMSSGGPDSGIWKSTDGGETWRDITGSLGLSPAQPIGKIGLAVSGANSNRIWALLEHEPSGGVYRSDDGGRAWEYMNDERKLRQRAFYYSRIYADPKDENVVYALNTGFYKSTDGGKTFPTQLRVPHGDNHDLWIASNDPNRMINSNDGGGNVSVNGGQTWTDQDFPTAQFYRVITTAHEPYHICGAQQDNSTACMPSGGWDHLSAGGNYFYDVGGCESGYIAPNPRNPNIFYAGCYGGSLSRYDHATGETRAVNVWPENPMGWSSKDIRERVQWTFPIVFDRHDAGILYTGTQKVWRTRNEGQSWEEISPDITRSDPMTMVASGGPITKDQTGVETYAVVFAIEPSRTETDVVWAGSDDGYVHITRNARAAQPTWENVTPPDAPDFVRINTIESSPHAAGKAYVAGIRYLVDNDRSPYVWKTTDYGKTWTRIVSGIPANDFVRAVREDPTRPGLLYAASETTVYVSWDDGAHWQSLGLNLPNTQVSDLVVEDHDLVISTHGRSFWVMRNIGILRQLTAEVAAADFWLFDPKDPVRGFDNTAEIQYNLKNNAEKVTVELLDERGGVLASFASAEGEEQPRTPSAGGGGGGGEGGGFGGRPPVPSKMKGSNVFRWGMRTAGWTDFEGRIFWAAGPIGPAVLPGRYQVRLTVDGKSQTRGFEIKMNPRAADNGVTLADLQARYDLATKIRDRVTAANQAVVTMRAIKTQVDDRLGKSDNGELRSLGGTVKDRLSGVESQIYQVRNRSNQDPLNYPIMLNNKIAALLNLVEGSERRPTDQSYTVFEMLSGQLEGELEQMNLVIVQDLARLNELLRQLGLDPIDLTRLITE